MQKSIKEKIHDLRLEPEVVRLRVIMTSIFVAGSLLFLLWIFVFLPLQIKSGTQEPTAATLEQSSPTPTASVGEVAGRQSDRSSSVTPSPSTQAFEALPSSEEVNPTATPVSSSPSSLPVSITP